MELCGFWVGVEGKFVTHFLLLPPQRTLCEFFVYFNKSTIFSNFLFQCSNGGCLIELAQQLAVIMVGKQIINNAQEILIPKMKAWWHNKKVIYKEFFLSIEL